MAISTYLAGVWSATDFDDPAITRYAEAQIIKDTRLGVQTMAGLALLMLAVVSATLLYRGLGSIYLKTSLLVAALSLHVYVSAALTKDVRSLHALGITFLVIGALAITLLAHRTGSLDIGVIAAVAMLFTAIPIVPWALREASVVIASTYLLLTLSLASVPGRFASDSFWVLQLLVLGAAVIAFIVTARNTFIRRRNIRARFELENARNELEQLSMKDHLTGAWNRRFLDKNFDRIAAECAAQKRALHVAVLDLDDFKGLNDNFGHHVGDRILINVARTFLAHLENKGYLIRMGGDEFQIIYTGDGLDWLIEQAISQLQQGTVAGELDDQHFITLSTGIASTQPGQRVDLETMYKKADRALYAAKENKPAPSSEPPLLTRTGTWKL